MKYLIYDAGGQYNKPFGGYYRRPALKNVFDTLAEAKKAAQAHMLEGMHGQKRTGAEFKVTWKKVPIDAPDVLGITSGYIHGGKQLAFQIYKVAKIPYRKLHGNPSRRGPDRPHITKRGRELLARPDMQPAVKLFEKATRASRAHSKLVSESFDKYGDQGPLISGIAREHFPVDVKNRLRKLARDINKYADAAYYARPKGVRNTTMQALAGAVATKTGTGFYGPRGENPKRKGTKTMPRKKQRTAKQRAATKKMLAANRARLRKKTKTARRKTTRRKTRRKTRARRNPQKARPGLKKSHLQLIFKCERGRVMFAALTGVKPVWSSDKGKAILFRTQKNAQAVAGQLQRQRGNAKAFIGVTHTGTSTASIKRYCASFQELAPGKA